MIAARWAMLAVATLLILAALGAVGGAETWQPSVLRLAVTTVLAVLALLFWPGAAATPRGTLFRVVGWSTAVVGLAALTLRVAGQGLQSWPKIAVSCAVLWLLLLVCHALAAALECRLRAADADAAAAREAAGRIVALALLLLGALPLWGGPVAELVSGRQEWAVDAALAASPLTHLAVGSGNDLLRNHWLYQHVNVAALRFNYPGLDALLWSYAGVALALPMMWLGRLKLSRQRAAGPSNSSTLENST